MSDTFTALATPEECQRALSDAVARRVAKGWRVESQNATSAVLVKGKPVNHTFHLLFSVFTVGIWAFTVWPFLAIFGGEKRCMVRVDQFGHTWTEKL